MLDDYLDRGNIIVIRCSICGDEIELEYIPGMRVNPYCSIECELAGTGQEQWIDYE